ncbi:MAG: F0F1 ATP synthase subunit B [Candidatus Moranbacteria bacterium]|nr:F0F1 ATP synthase subunit B [Candidatus Moranbacteria bacterium]
MDVLAKLGIDGKLLLAQAVNFIILLWVLKRFAYRPILDFLEQRTQRIEQGLKDAEAAQAKLAEMEKQEKEVLVAARKEARELLVAAEASAKKRDQERLRETEERVKKLLAEAEAKRNEEREKMLADTKNELAETVVLAVEKVLREKMDSATEKAFIEKSVR